MGKTTQHLGRAPFCTLGGRGPQPLFIILALAGGPRGSLEEGLPWDRLGPTPGLPRGRVWRWERDSSRCDRQEG